MIKYILIAFAMSPDFHETETVIGKYEKPSECMAAYLDKEFKPKPDNVYYRCQEIDADGKYVMKTYTGPVVVVHPPRWERQPDIVIEYRERFNP